MAVSTDEKDAWKTPAVVSFPLTEEELTRIDHAENPEAVLIEIYHSRKDGDNLPD